MPREIKDDQLADDAYRPGLPKERTAFRDYLEYIAVLLVVVLLLRQTVVEAFRIRHGSMAPVLLGDHQEIRCPNCGWFFHVGSDKEGAWGDVECPNCRYVWRGASRYDSRGEPLSFKRPEWLWNSAYGSDGTHYFGADAANRVLRGSSRIFVNKLVYELRKPRRWEVIVFLYPLYTITCKYCDWTGQVESLQDAVCPECGGRDFEVETKDFIKRVAGLPGETVSLKDGDVCINGRIARKPRGVQEGLWFHVFDSGFWPRREEKPTWNMSGAPERWRREVDGGSLLLDASGAVEPVTASFGRPVTDFCAYDGVSFEVDPRSTGASGQYRVGDVRIRAQVRVLGRDPAGGEALLTIEDAGHRLALSAGIGEGGRLVLTDNGTPISQSADRGLALDKSQWLTLENYDDRAVARLDGREVGSYEYEGRPGGRQAVSFGARGAQVLWEHIIIERDIYYTDVEGKLAHGASYEIKPDEYFVLGDNSPASSDSRRWDRPGIPGRNIIGQAFFTFWPVQEMRWFRSGSPSGSAAGP